MAGDGAHNAHMAMHMHQSNNTMAAADAGDAAEALAALQGSSRGMAPSQAPGAPPMTAQILPGLRVPGMGRGSSLYRGVSKAGDKKKWRAMIQHNHEQHHVGYYPTAEEAARAYDRKALLFMGPSAITNFPATDYNGINLEADGSVEDQMKKRRRTRTSQFRGVTRSGAKWRAAIRINNVKRELGVFESEAEAARAYDAEALQMFGPTATLNFGASAPSPGDAAAQAQPQPSHAFPASAPDGAEQLAMLASAPVNYQQDPELSPPMTGPPPPEAQQSSQQETAVPLPRFLGVRPAGNGQYIAQVVVDLGKFNTEEEAAAAYDRASVWCLGLTSRLNFPAEQQIGGDGSMGNFLSEDGPQGGESYPRQNFTSQMSSASAGPQDNTAQASGSAAEQPASAPSNFPMALQNPPIPARPDKLSRYVGLSKKHNRWKALIKVHGKRKELGSFTTEEGAARCYDKHAVLAWGARARTNFNSLELMCSMPEDAQVILDAMREGKGQREAARQHMGGGGLISQVVASALGQLPNVIDSSTQEGQHAHAAIASALAEQNTKKKSAYRGVHANWSRWRAQIYVGGRRRELGSFDTEAEAARAYDFAAISLYGEDRAKTNFPASDYAHYLALAAQHAAAAQPAEPLANASQLVEELQQVVANQDESAASQGVEPPTLQQALPQVHPQLQPFLGQMLAAAQMQGYGNEQQQQQSQLPPSQQLQGISNMTPVPPPQDDGPNDQHQQQEDEQ